MSKDLGRKFLKVSLIYFLIAITVGAVFSIAPVRNIIILSTYMAEFHAHLSLIGWVSMALLGLIYRNLEDKGIPYNESLGFKGFLLLLIGAILMPIMLFLTGIVHILTIKNIGVLSNENPIIGLVVIAAIILLLGAYISVYNIYRALENRI